MTTAEQWARAGREELDETAVPLPLPSGLTVKARRPGPMFFATRGKVIMGLAGAAAGVSGSNAGNVSEREAGEYLLFMRDLLVETVVSPRISMTPGSGEIHPDAIPPSDATYIIAWAIRGPEAVSLESFRRESRIRGGSGNGEDIRIPAKRTVGNLRSGTRAERGPRRKPGVPAGSTTGDR